MKDEDFYHQLSTKELQSLCRKYGLLANQSKSDMANLLITYVRNKSTPGQTSSSQVLFQGKVNSNGTDANFKGSPRLKSSHNVISSAGGGKNKLFQRLYRDINGGVCPSEDATPFSSFEFHVRSDEGINLYVDLDTSPSEWASKLYNEVSVCTNMYTNKAQGLEQQTRHTGEGSKETVRPYSDDVNAGQVKDDFQQSGPPPGTITVKSSLVDCHPLNGTDGSSHSSRVIPHNIDCHPVNGTDGSSHSSRGIACNMASDVSIHSEDQIRVSFVPDSNRRNEISFGIESCPESDGAIAVHSNIERAIEIKSASSSALESVSDGPMHQVSLERQNAYYNQEAHEDAVLHGSNFFVNHDVLPGCSASSPTKVHLSEVSSYHQSTMTMDKPGLAEPNKLISGKHQSYPAEGMGKSNSINGKESSEGSQHEISEEYIHLRSGDTETNGNCSKKRPHIDLSNGNDKPNAKISRGTKHQTGEIIPRRSMRLFPKVTLTALLQPFTSFLVSLSGSHWPRS